MPQLELRRGGSWRGAGRARCSRAAFAAWVLQPVLVMPVIRMLDNQE